MSLTQSNEPSSPACCVTQQLVKWFLAFVPLFFRVGARMRVYQVHTSSMSSPHFLSSSCHRLNRFDFISLSNVCYFEWVKMYTTFHQILKTKNPLIMRCLSLRAYLYRSHSFYKKLDMKSTLFAGAQRYIYLWEETSHVYIL